MKIDKLLYEHFAELRLRGEFDTFYAPRLTDEVDQLIATGYRHVILNLRLVKFINSTALGSIIKANKRARAEGGDLVVAQPSGFVRDVMTQIGVDRVVPMFDDFEKAKEHLQKQMQRDDTPTVIGDSTVLFEVEEPERIAKLGGRRTGLGTVLRVDHERLRFSWDGGGRGLGRADLESLFAPGLPLRNKFKVKLCKNDYFDVASQIESTEAKQQEDRSWGIVVTAKHTNLGDADRLALAQFADDLDYLKQQLKDVR
jgi:anti-anti-sigma factor